MPPCLTNYTPAFLHWYSHYPLKVAKQHAAKKYVEAIKNVQHLYSSSRTQAEAFLLERAQLYATSPEGMGPYCPHPGTWLNKGRWEDDDTTWFRGSNGAAGGDRAAQESWGRVLAAAVKVSVYDAEQTRQAKQGLSERELQLVRDFGGWAAIQNCKDTALLMSRYIKRFTEGSRT